MPDLEIDDTNDAGWEVDQEVKLTTIATIVETGSNYIEVEFENGTTLTVRTDYDDWNIEEN